MGDVDLKSAGTITPMRGNGGWQTTIANLAGRGAKSLIDSKLSKARKTTDNSAAKNDATGNFGQKMADAISKIPAGSYSQLISAGLGLIFGRTSVQNDYDLSVTTTGKVEFSGAGITEATSGIPSVTFNLYVLMDSTDDKVNSSSSFVYNLADGQEHYVGVWNLKVAPKVFYNEYQE